MGLAVEYKRTLVDACAAALIAEFAAGGHIVVERIEKHRAHLEEVGVACYVLEYEKLIILVVALFVTYTHTGNPLALGYELYLLEVALELFLGRGMRKG